MSNFDFTKTLLNGSKQYIDNKTSDGSTHNHSWNDLEDRPFYETEPVERLFCDIDSISGTNNEVPIETLLIEDKTYIVIYNEEKYECIARKDENGAIIIGNEYVGNSYYEDRDTGEPFYVSTYYSYPDWGVIAVKDDNSSLKIIYYETSIVELENKYIPYVVGKKVEGKTMTDYNNDKHIGGVGSEIFNNYKKNIASGEYSHAEGDETRALGYYSHAEGRWTTASGDSSHAEGNSTEASGNSSHAEGEITTASAYCAHAEGRGTIAASEVQHVQGKYNIEDAANAYAHIVGNGQWGKKSNAHTLDWNGNAWFQGEVYVGGTGQDDTAAKKLVTSDDIQTVTADIESKADADFSNVEDSDFLLKARQSGASGIPIVPATRDTSSGNEVYVANVEGLGTSTRPIDGYTITIIPDDSAETATARLQVNSQPAYLIKFRGTGRSNTVITPTEPWINMGVPINLTYSGYNGAWLTDIQKIIPSDIGAASQVDLDAKSSATNLVNGFGTSSLRSIGSSSETGQYAMAVGNASVASGDSAFASGYQATAYGAYSHAEGRNTNAIGENSHAEGRGYTGTIKLTGDANAKTYTVSADSSEIRVGRVLKYGTTYAKITGYDSSTLTITTSATLSSSALSSTTVTLYRGIAYGVNSHVEGYYTTASGESTHAEGYQTIAAGNYSHAEGSNTIAFSASQHAQGKFNIEDKSATYAHIVGNGTSNSARSNAHTLDWDGNAWFAGDVYLGGTGQSDANKMADYVIEEGWDGGTWRYRKWASGLSEAWYQYYTTIQIATAWGSLYYATLLDSLSYPSGLFVNSEPRVYMFANHGEMWVTAAFKDITSIGPIYVASPTKKDYEYGVRTNIYVVGRWDG